MINFENRLQKLKDRRQGTRELNLVESGYAADSLFDSRPTEVYESLTESSGIKYVIGAMAAVSDASTRVSIEEGERVADTLISMLQTDDINAIRRMQGSVALDIHIEGHSDVDMLIIYRDVVSVEFPKLNGQPLGYCSDTRTMPEIIRELRLASEDKLTTRYYAAKVDCTGNKSIALSEGSLKRKVDIVPACWHNCYDYQRSGNEHDRTVKVYHKGDNKLIPNKPFLHIKNVNDRDRRYDGNLKKVVRLMKNLVADLPADKNRVAKKLSSYDLTGIAYNMDAKLAISSFLPFALLQELSSYLWELSQNERLRQSIEVPDGTRKVFDSEEKEAALTVLRDEVTALCAAVHSEIAPSASQYSEQVLKSKVITL